MHACRHRVAFRYVAGEKEERFTYGEVHRYAAAWAASSCSAGVKRGDRVMLVSENRPEWGISYFGILRAGGTAVPVDPSLTEAEVVNIARRAEAKVLPALRGDRRRTCPGLHARAHRGGPVHAGALAWRRR